VADVLDGPAVGAQGEHATRGPLLVVAGGLEVFEEVGTP
jgi:hypothetical protein